MKININVTFELEEENAEFIKDNMTKLIRERLDRWPSDVSDVQISLEELSY